MISSASHMDTRYLTVQTTVRTVDVPVKLKTRYITFLGRNAPGVSHIVTSAQGKLFYLEGKSYMIVGVQYECNTYWWINMDSLSRWYKKDTVKFPDWDNRVRFTHKPIERECKTCAKKVSKRNLPF